MSAVAHLPKTLNRPALRSWMLSAERVAAGQFVGIDYPSPEIVALLCSVLIGCLDEVLDGETGHKPGTLHNLGWSPDVAHDATELPEHIQQSFADTEHAKEMEQRADAEVARLEDELSEAKEHAVTLEKAAKGLADQVESLKSEVESTRDQRNQAWQLLRFIERAVTERIDRETMSTILKNTDEKVAS